MPSCRSALAVAILLSFILLSPCRGQEPPAAVSSPAPGVPGLNPYPSSAGVVDPLASAETSEDEPGTEDWDDFTPPERAKAQKPSPEELRAIHTLSPGVQVVEDDPDSPRVYPLESLVNHATLIQVPYPIQKAWCGDLQAWTLEGDSNYVSVKPLGPEQTTNLHVLTTNGRMYNFRLYSRQSGSYTDVIQVRKAEPYGLSEQAIREKREAELKAKLEAELQAAYEKKAANGEFEYIRAYAESAAWGYRVDQARTFRVRGVFSDQAFTYFTVLGDERPTVYLETARDTKPATRVFTLGLHRHKWVRELLNFDLTRGNFYRVQRVLRRDQRLVLLLRDDQATIRRKAGGD